MLSRVLMRVTFRRPPPVVAVVRLAGVSGGPARSARASTWRPSVPLLLRAFRQPGVKAVALEINSPGGSATQSALIHNRIRALAAERDVPVMAFVEDVAASGGYWLAAAADEIFVDDNSIVGSIGVIYSGFGFQEALAKLGVERRLYTAGEKKSLLDPFLAVNPMTSIVCAGFRGHPRQLQGSDPRAARRPAGRERSRPLQRRVLAWPQGDRAGARRRHRRYPSRVARTLRAQRWPCAGSAAAEAGSRAAWALASSSRAAVRRIPARCRRPPRRDRGSLLVVPLRALIQSVRVPAGQSDLAGGCIGYRLIFKPDDPAGSDQRPWETVHDFDEDQRDQPPVSRRSRDAASLVCPRRARHDRKQVRLRRGALRCVHDARSTTAPSAPASPRCRRRTGRT